MFTTQSHSQSNRKERKVENLRRGRIKMGWMSRFLAAVAFLAIGVIFSPETFGHHSHPNLLSILKLAHLLCFSVAFGAALWVTFIGGIIMFKYLSFFLPPSLLPSSVSSFNPQKGFFFYIYILVNNIHSPASSRFLGICRGINLGTCRQRCSRPTSLW